jgi:hypothetical protein
MGELIFYITLTLQWIVEKLKVIFLNQRLASKKQVSDLYTYHISLNTQTSLKYMIFVFNDIYIKHATIYGENILACVFVAIGVYLNHCEAQYCVVKLNADLQWHMDVFTRQHWASHGFI